MTYLEELAARNPGAPARNGLFEACSEVDRLRNLNVVTWSPVPPSNPGFYWLKRRDESLTVVCISKTLLCYSTHGHSGSKRGSLQGLWSGQISLPH